MSDDTSEVYQKRDIILAEMHSDIKHLVKNFDKHVEDDTKIQEDLVKKVDWAHKVLYMGLGAITLIQVGIKFIK